MRCQLLSFSCAILGGILISAVSASCYYPDGSFPSDYAYTPCSGDQFTSCCIASEGDQCLSNGLCYSPGDGYMFRGACTDSSWGSQNCFQHCINSTSDSSSSYDAIVSCGDDRYCCSSDDDTCCNDDSTVFHLGSLSVIKDLATTSRTVPGFPAATVSSTTYGSPAGIMTSAATPTSASLSPTSDSMSSSNGVTASHTTMIAVSVIALVVFVIGMALFWYCVRRNYRKKLAQGGQEQAFPMSNEGFHKLPDNKSTLPAEPPPPVFHPAPPYQPPAYQNPLQQHPPDISNSAVEMEGSAVPGTKAWGQAAYEVPAEPYRHV